MSDPYFFGYGSLVNTKTHVYQDARPAKLSGWRRVWKRTNARDMAFLTIVPSDRTELLGLIAKVPNADWVALDAREEGYDRLVATDMITHDHSDNTELLYLGDQDLENPDQFYNALHLNQAEL